MPQEAASGLVVVDPDASSSLPPSSSLPRTQLSPETLRALVLKCGREAEGEASCLSAAAPSTSHALKARDRLRGQLGFCFDPMPWEQAVAAIADGGVEAMGQMGRTPEGVARYWRWRDEVCAKEYASTADYVRVEIMGFEVGVAGGELCVFFSFSFPLSSKVSNNLSRLPSHSLDNNKNKTGERSRGLLLRTRARESSGGKTCVCSFFCFGFFFSFLLSLLSISQFSFSPPPPLPPTPFAGLPVQLRGRDRALQRVGPGAAGPTAARGVRRGAEAALRLRDRLVRQSGGAGFDPGRVARARAVEEAAEEGGGGGRGEGSVKEEGFGEREKEEDEEKQNLVHFHFFV